MEIFRMLMYLNLIINNIIVYIGLIDLFSVTLILNWLARPKYLN